MSTENTQSDVTSSGGAAESSAPQTGSVETSNTVERTADTTPVNSFDNLKKASKEYSPKSVDQAIAETKPAAPVAPAYAANFKYKAALQEKEIEEFWRPLIKDQDSEKKVKDFLSKLDGFEHVKGSRDKLQTQFESLANDYQAQSQVVKRVEGALHKKDYASAFRQLNISDEEIFKYTHQKLQLMEMPADQRKVYEERDQFRTQQEQLQEQVTRSQQQFEQINVQARTMQLDMVLSRNDISSAAQSWDSLQGQPGAFRDLVIQEAASEFYRTGRDLSAEQAAQHVMQKFGKVMSQSGGSQASQTPDLSSQTQSIPAPQAAKPVIPNVNGKGTTPIKKVPTSIADLKRMAKELQSQEDLTN